MTLKTYVIKSGTHQEPTFVHGKKSGFVRQQWKGKAKSRGEELYREAVDKFGQEAVNIAMQYLYIWTKGDEIFKNMTPLQWVELKKVMQPLTVFKDKRRIPKYLLKGITPSFLAGKIEHYMPSNDKLKEMGLLTKDKEFNKTKLSEMAKERLAGRLASFTRFPTTAARFAPQIWGHEGYAIEIEPKDDEIFCDVDLIPKKYRFAGAISHGANPIFYYDTSPTVVVPSKENEFVVVLKPSSKIKLQNIPWSYSHYVGGNERPELVPWRTDMNKKKYREYKYPELQKKKEKEG